MANPKEVVVVTINLAEESYANLCEASKQASREIPGIGVKVDEIISAVTCDRNTLIAFAKLMAKSKTKFN